MNVGNIHDISKLTVQEGKQGSSLCNESDSLSIYNAGPEQSKSGKLTSVKSTKRQTEYDTSPSNIGPKQSRKDKSQAQSGIQGNSINMGEQKKNEKVVAREKSIQGNEDSIEEMKKYEWENELGEIQHHLQDMMARASR